MNIGEILELTLKIFLYQELTANRLLLWVFGNNLLLFFI